jgi:hypothetical protein
MTENIGIYLLFKEQNNQFCRCQMQLEIFEVRFSSSFNSSLWNNFETI